MTGSAPAATEPHAPSDKLVTEAGLEWHTDYDAAHRAAERDGRMLLILFASENDAENVASLQQTIETDAELQRELRGLTLARLAPDATIEEEGERVRLLDSKALVHLGGGTGIAIVDLRDADAAYYGQVVTALPFADGKYYRWQDSHLRVALELPAGTISQRTMVWAVRVHPEAPASTVGYQHPELADAAAEHSEYQARIGVQGHHRWGRRFHELRAAVSAERVSEVVAESWPNQDLIDSCLDCVRSWRYSPGHWRAVRLNHRLYGYDICRGSNGIWYGTGIFAD